jgi:glutathione peroxidase
MYTKILSFIFILLLMFTNTTTTDAQKHHKRLTVHDFQVKDLEGHEVPLSNYKGKVLLIVNTASKCGFTPQLEDMEAVYKEFKGQGLEVLAFPSNDFNDQEPLEGAAIRQFCVTKYEAEYPIFDKIHVKGENADPLYKFLSDKTQNGVFSSVPKWNFHKYLVDKNGKVVDYYYSITKPNAEKVKTAIKKLLEQ